MWLLDTNADQIKLRQFVEPKDYAILPHRWESSDEELLFDEIMQGDFSRDKRGLYKVSKAIEQAREDGLGLLWIDSCCIDKRSSAELQEAINSMYSYYRQASVCYVYLSDVLASRDETFNGNLHRSFTGSEWFQNVPYSGGWTLQELIVPENLKFYNAGWQYLGDKKDLSSLIFLSTGISSHVLTGTIKISQYSIAQRMSWAAKRQTTRVEDRAYSLLGIFNVNMPMLYGEGEKAFLRLQQEIINHSDDHSIFAWSDPSRCSMLASSPDAFANSNNVQTRAVRECWKPYNFSNRGLSIEILVAPYSPNTYLAILNCERSGEVMGIFIRQLYQDDQYARVTIDGEDLVDDIYQYISRQCDKRRCSVYVCLDPPLNEPTEYLRDRVFGVQLKVWRIVWGHTDPSPEVVKKYSDSDSTDGYIRLKDSTSKVVKAMPSHEQFDCVLMAAVIAGEQLPIKFVMFGFDEDFNPVLLACASPQLPNWNGDRMDWSDEIHINSFESNSSCQIDILDQLFREYTRLNPGVTDQPMLDILDATSPKGSKPVSWNIRGDREDGVFIHLKLGEIIAGPLIMRRTYLSEDLIWKVELVIDPRDLARL